MVRFYTIKIVSWGQAGSQHNIIWSQDRSHQNDKNDLSVSSMEFRAGQLYTSSGGEEKERIMDRVLKIILGAAYLLLGLVLLGFAVRNLVVGDTDITILACIVGAVCTSIGLLFVMSNRDTLNSSHA